jgi:hypothetical protein
MGLDHGLKPMPGPSNTGSVNIDRMYDKIHDAIVFITKPLGIPEGVAESASLEATARIIRYFKEVNENKVDKGNRLPPS